MHNMNTHNFGNGNRLITGILLIKQSPKAIILFLISILPSVIGFYLNASLNNLIILLVSVSILIDIFSSVLTGIFNLYLTRKAYLRNQNNFMYWFLLIVEIILYLTLCLLYFLTQSK